MHVDIGGMRIGEDHRPWRGMPLYYVYKILVDLVLDEVGNHDFGAPAVEPEHPAHFGGLGQKIELRAAHFRLINLDRAWQVQKRKDLLLHVEVHRLATNYEGIEGPLLVETHFCDNSGVSAFEPKRDGHIEFLHVDTVEGSASVEGEEDEAEGAVPLQVQLGVGAATLVDAHLRVAEGAVAAAVEQALLG